MIIFEIALGIVLAFIILAFLPYIISAGLLLLGIGVVIAVVLAAIYATGTVQTVAILVIVIAGIIWFEMQSDNSSPKLKQESATDNLYPRLKQDDAERMLETLAKEDVDSKRSGDSNKKRYSNKIAFPWVLWVISIVGSGCIGALEGGVFGAFIAIALLGGLILLNWVQKNYFLPPHEKEKS